MHDNTIPAIFHFFVKPIVIVCLRCFFKAVHCIPTEIEYGSETREEEKKTTADIIISSQNGLQVTFMVFYLSFWSWNSFFGL